MSAATITSCDEVMVGKTDLVTAYAQQVVNGDIIAGEAVRLQCQRHLDDLENGPDRGLYWDYAAAMKPVYWVADHIVFAEGGFAGKPFIMDQHQVFITGSLFGWKRVETGYRRFNTAYIEEGKGNGKSPWLAAIGLYCLLEDDEPNASIVTAARARVQARVVFDDAIRFAKGNPYLSARLTVTENYIRIKGAGSDRSEFKPVSSEAGNLAGPRPSVAFVDELCTHDNDKVITALRDGFKHRRQPLLLITTNAGNDLKTTCGRWHKQVKNVLAGIFENDSLFGYICELDEGDDYTNESVWPKTNPLIGNGYNLEYLRGQVKTSIQMPSQMAGVLRLNFCKWTQQGETWLDPVAWKKLAVNRSNKELAGKAWGRTLDLSENDDLTCVMNFFPDDDGGLFVKPKFYLPEDSLSDREDPEIVSEMMKWATTGALDNDDPDFEPWLNLTPGGMIDQRIIKDAILSDLDMFGGLNFPYDQWNTKQIALELFEEVATLDLVKYDQSNRAMNEPSKWVERAIYHKNITHDGNPVMHWMIGNVALEEDSVGRVRPSKKKSSAKIDGVAALVMGVGGWLFPLMEKVKMSVYSDPKRGDVGIRKMDW